MDKGTILIFDRFIINENWEPDEYKALNYFCSNNNLTYEVLAVSFFYKPSCFEVNWNLTNKKLCFKTEITNNQNMKSISLDIDDNPQSISHIFSISLLTTYRVVEQLEKMKVYLSCLFLILFFYSFLHFLPSKV